MLALVTLFPLLTSISARQLQQANTYQGAYPCTVGQSGNSYCSSLKNQFSECVPLKYAFPNGNYNSTAGGCAAIGNVTPTYTFKSFTYTPPDNSWDSVTQKAFIGIQRCNDQTRNSNQACQLTYNKATTTSTSTTFTQSLALEADFTFKVGGCALCPAEADTTFKVTGTVGFQENYSNSSTTSFSASVTSNPPPGNCTVAVFSVNYLNNFEAQFEANVDATCMAAVSFTGSDSQAHPLVPCPDIANDLKAQPGFTGTVTGVTGDVGPGQVAHIQLSGTQIVSFGTSVNSDVCDCSDQPCIDKAKATAAGGQTNAAGVNAATLPKGVQASDIGKAQPLSASQMTCDTCTAVTGAPAGSGTSSGPSSSKSAPAPTGSKSG